jgi:glycerophosphoryl diester phosphodiesterase
MNPQGWSAAWGLFRRALASGRPSWKRLLATDVLYKLLAVALLTPLAGLALRAGIAIAGEEALADQEILYFVLRPAGLVTLVVLAGISITIVALEQASLMALVAEEDEAARIPVERAVAWAATRAPRIWRVAAWLVGRCILLALPFLVAIGLVYGLLLREFDINYYLRYRPPVFYVAAGLVALLLLGLLVRLLPRVAAWVLALPILLFEPVRPRATLAESERRTAGHRPLVVRTLLLWAAGTMLLSLTVPPLFLALGRLLVPHGRGNVGLVLALMLALAAAWSLAHLAISWASASTFALLLVRLYEERAGGKADLERGDVPEGPGWLRRFRPTAKQLGFGLATAAFVTVALAWLLLRAARPEDGVVVIAHRGAAAFAPENTLASVDAALAQGADFVEIDVQETADDEIVVVHDSDFMRVAGSSVKVWESNWPDLQKLDAGSWFDAKFSGERVPRLRDVLDRARGRARVVIELKQYGHGEQLEHRVVELVEELGDAERMIVMSLDRGMVRTVRALRPKWTVGLLTATAVGDLTEVDADFLAVNSNLASRRFVRQAHRAGKKVYVWTVNDPVRMFQMLNLGVDGLITDTPALARTVLERRARLDPFQRLLVGVAIWFGAANPDPPASADGG